MDAFTGYRRHAADQLERADRLVALKDLGFTLEQVGRILDDQLDARQWRSLLEARPTSCARGDRRRHIRLQAVEARLSALREENSMSHSDFHTKALPALSWRRSSPRSARERQCRRRRRPARPARPDPRHHRHATARPGHRLLQRRRRDPTAAAAAQVAPTGVPDGLTAVALPAVPPCLGDDVDRREISGIQPGVAGPSSAKSRPVKSLVSDPCQEVHLRTPFDGGSAWVVELQQPLG